MGYHFREQDSFVRIVELTPAMREQIEATIEHLLSVLDHFDGDENLENDDPAEDGGDDETSLGWTEVQARDGQYGADYMSGWFLGYDRELDTSDDEDGGDDEPGDSGIADQDALYDPDVRIVFDFDFNGSGAAVAKSLLKQVSSPAPKR